MFPLHRHHNFKEIGPNHRDMQDTRVETVVSDFCHIIQSEVIHHLEHFIFENKTLWND